MRYAGVLFLTFAFALVVGRAVLDRLDVALYLVLAAQLGIGAVAPVEGILERMGWQDPAKRMLASWAARCVFSLLAFGLGVCAATSGWSGVALGRWPWVATFVILGALTLTVHALRIGDRRPEGE